MMTRVMLMVCFKRSHHQALAAMGLALCATTSDLAQGESFKFTVELANGQRGNISPERADGLLQRLLQMVFWLRSLKV